jgi:hypothetical protein
MNPGVAAMHGTPAAAPPEESDEGQTITITKNSDGTVTCDDGSGQPTEHKSLDEALDYAKNALGGEEHAASEHSGGSNDSTDSGASDNEY